MSTAVDTLRERVERMRQFGAPDDARILVTLTDAETILEALCTCSPCEKQHDE